MFFINCLLDFEDKLPPPEYERKEEEEKKNEEKEKEECKSDSLRRLVKDSFVDVRDAFLMPHSDGYLCVGYPGRIGYHSFIQMLIYNPSLFYTLLRIWIHEKMKDFHSSEFFCDVPHAIILSSLFFDIGSFRETLFKLKEEMKEQEVDDLSCVSFFFKYFFEKFCRMFHQMDDCVFSFTLNDFHIPILPNFDELCKRKLQWEKKREELFQKKNLDEFASTLKEIIQDESPKDPPISTKKNRVIPLKKDLAKVEFEEIQKKLEQNRKDLEENENEKKKQVKSFPFWKAVCLIKSFWKRKEVLSKMKKNCMKRRSIIIELFVISVNKWVILVFLSERKNTKNE